MLLGFKPRFIEPIEAGVKIHTFRENRKDKRLPKSGETFYMYTGLRTKNCQFISKKHVSCGSQKTRMWIKKTNHINPEGYPVETIEFQIHIGDKRYWSTQEFNEMAINDGFSGTYEFLKYWLNGRDKVVFSGWCYHWTDFKY